MQLNFLYSLYILKSCEVHLLVLVVLFKNLIRMFTKKTALILPSQSACHLFIILLLLQYIIYLSIITFTMASTINKSTESGKSKHPCVESIQPLTIKYHVRFRFFKVTFVILWQYFLLLVLTSVC